MYKLIKIICLVLLPAGLLFSGESKVSITGPIKIFIIAGQSNAINIHSDAAELDLSLIDTSVNFYYHCGMPPASGHPFFSTSDNKWTSLGIQRQIPYLAHHEYYFGPEITLINSLNYSQDNIAVIKCAYGGSNLAIDWNRNSLSGNMLYNLMTDQISNACSIFDSLGRDYSFAGFFWIQGESDASNYSHAQAYLENLKNFINGIRSDLNSPELPFIISRLPAGQPYNYLSLVRDAQEKAAQDLKLTKCINTDNLELDTDDIHFTSSGIKELGYLFADALSDLVSSNNEFSDLQVIKNTFISQNYPNPFNSSTKINLFIARTEHIVVKVYDILGNEISEIINTELKPGEYQLGFNAHELPSGVYFYKISSGNRARTIKMQVLK